MAKSNPRGRRVNATLNTENIDKLVNYMNGVKYGLRQNSADRLIAEMRYRAIQEFRRNIRQSIHFPEYSTGDMEAGADVSTEIKNLTKGQLDFRMTLVNSAKGYAFFEYGTGIVGAEDPHPMLDSSSYDLNGHGDDGWKFPSKVRFNTKGKPQWIPTKGQPASMAMYNTREEIKDTYPRELATKISRAMPRKPILK